MNNVQKNNNCINILSSQILEGEEYSVRLSFLHYALIYFHYHVSNDLMCHIYVIYVTVYSRSYY
jgi:hypothetical protein